MDEEQRYAMGYRDGDVLHLVEYQCIGERIYLRRVRVDGRPMRPDRELRGRMKVAARKDYLDKLRAAWDKVTADRPARSRRARRHPAV